MDRFSNAREAKEFLIARIVEEAKRENVPLSEVERKMLYFSETGWTLPDIMEVNDAFDREYDQAEFEKKISHLIRNETRRIRKDNRQELATWVSAVQELKKEDHYISVMIDRAGIGISKTKPRTTRNFILQLVIAGLVLLGLNQLNIFGVVGGRGQQFGSVTLDEKLNRFYGYAWLCFLVLVLSILAYSHFDPKRRVYRMFDRIVAGTLKLFGVREK